MSSLTLAHGCDLLEFHVINSIIMVSIWIAKQDLKTELTKSYICIKGHVEENTEQWKIWKVNFSHLLLCIPYLKTKEHVLYHTMPGNPETCYCWPRTFMTILGTSFMMCLQFNLRKSPCWQAEVPYIFTSL